MSIFWLAAVLVAPGLGVLVVLMEWLEHLLARQMTAEDVAAAPGWSRRPEQRAEVARSAAILVRGPTA